MYKKNNYLMDLIICMFLLMFSLLINYYSANILSYLNITELNSNNFAIGVWQTQIAISLISISLVSITIANTENVILGQKLSEILMIRNKSSITYWDKIFICFILGIINTIFIYKVSIISETFIFIINVILIIITIKDTFDIISYNDKFILKSQNYIIYILSNINSNNLLKDNLSQKFNLSIRNKIVLNELNFTDELNLIYKLIKGQNEIPSYKKFIKLNLNTLIKNLIYYDKYIELNKILKDLNNLNIYLTEENLEIIVSSVEESGFIFKFQQSILLSEKINCLIELYKLVDKTYIKNNNLYIRNEFNLITDMIKKINNDLLNTNYFNLFKQLLIGINNTIDNFNIPEIFDALIKQFTDLYLKIKDDDFYKYYYFKEDNNYGISFNTKLINSLDNGKINIKQDEILCKKIASINISTINNIYINENLSDDDKNLMVELILSNHLAFNCKKEDYYKEREQLYNDSFYSKYISFINFGKLIEIFNKNNKYNFIKYYSKRFICKEALKNKDLKYYIFENIISLIYYLQYLYNNKKIDELNNILEYNQNKEIIKNILKNKDFKSFLIKNIFKSSNNYSKIQLFKLCLSKSNIKDVNFAHNFTTKTFTHECDFEFFEKTLDIKPSIDYKTIKYLRDKYKEYVIKNMINKNKAGYYNTIVKKYIKTFKDDLLKDINLIPNFNFNFKDNNYKATLKSNLILENLYIDKIYSFMETDSFRSYTNNFLIKKSLFDFLKNQIKKHLNIVEGFKNIEQITKSDTNIKFVLTEQNYNKSLYTCLKNNNYQAFLNYDEFIGKNNFESNDIFLLNDKYLNYNIGFKNINIVKCTNNKIQKILNDKFKTNNIISFTIDSVEYQLKRNELQSILECCLFEVELTVYFKDNIIDNCGYYFKENNNNKI